MIRFNCFLKSVSVKTYVRLALCFLTIISLLAGYLSLDSYTVVDGDNTYTVLSSRKNAEKILLSAGVSLSEDDVIETSL